MNKIAIETDWCKLPDRRRVVQVYYVNGEAVGTLLRGVARRIRARVAVPNAVIKKACLRAKETEEAVRLLFDGSYGTWRVQ